MLKRHARAAIAVWPRVQKPSTVLADVAVRTCLDTLKVSLLGVRAHAAQVC